MHFYALLWLLGYAAPWHYYKPYMLSYRDNNNHNIQVECIWFEWWHRCLYVRVHVVLLKQIFYTYIRCDAHRSSSVMQSDTQRILGRRQHGGGGGRSKAATACHASGNCVSATGNCVSSLNHHWLSRCTRRKRLMCNCLLWRGCAVTSAMSTMRADHRRGILGYIVRELGWRDV